MFYKGGQEGEVVVPHFSHILPISHTYQNTQGSRCSLKPLKSREFTSGPLTLKIAWNFV